MSSPPPTRIARFFELSAWLPRQRVWLWVALAVVAGLLLFGWVWLGDQGDRSATATPVAPVAVQPSGHPALPAPKPPGTGQTAPRSEDLPQPQLVQESPEPVAMPEPVSPTPARPIAAPRSPANDGGYVSPRPIAGRTPPPDYPRRALRRGESGSVTVRARIGADGVPLSASVAQSSGSRSLDRAAVAAVRRWRFHPAIRDGRPAPGSILVPINFDPR